MEPKKTLIARKSHPVGYTRQQWSVHKGMFVTAQSFDPKTITKREEPVVSMELIFRKILAKNLAWKTDLRRHVPNILTDKNILKWGFLRTTLLKQLLVVYKTKNFGVQSLLRIKNNSFEPDFSKCVGCTSQNCSICCIRWIADILEVYPQQLWDAVKGEVLKSGFYKTSALYYDPSYDLQSNSCQELEDAINLLSQYRTVYSRDSTLVYVIDKTPFQAPDFDPMTYKAQFPDYEPAQRLEKNPEVILYGQPWKQIFLRRSQVLFSCQEDIERKSEWNKRFIQPSRIELLQVYHDYQIFLAGQELFDPDWEKKMKLIEKK